MNDIFITGTDTGIGKTLVGCGIAAALTAQGKKVGVLKPAETGCQTQQGELYPDDAVRLAKFAKTTLPLDTICPYRFPLPVAPSVAAKDAGIHIQPDRITDSYRRITSQHDTTIVEGAGGLLVPLLDRYSFADLAHDLNIPILVVIGSKLGALNHALLTFDCIRTRRLQLAGYILNHPFDASDAAIRTNVATLAGLTDAFCLGVIPHVPALVDAFENQEAIANLFADKVDLSRLVG